MDKRDEASNFGYAAGQTGSEQDLEKAVALGYHGADGALRGAWVSFRDHGRMQNLQYLLKKYHPALEASDNTFFIQLQDTLIDFQSFWEGKPGALQLLLSALSPENRQALLAASLQRHIHISSIDKWSIPQDMVSLLETGSNGDLLNHLLILACIKHQKDTVKTLHDKGADFREALLDAALGSYMMTIKPEDAYRKVEAFKNYILGTDDMLEIIRQNVSDISNRVKKVEAAVALPKPEASGALHR